MMLDEFMERGRGKGRGEAFADLYKVYSKVRTCTVTALQNRLI